VRIARAEALRLKRSLRLAEARRLFGD
jgi:hypothetical protein